MTTDKSDAHRQAIAIDAAYRAGDLDALRAALGDPPDFPNCHHPAELGVGDHPLEYAIYWSPLEFIDRLIRLGADPNYIDEAGFPALIAALSSGRRDTADLLMLLVDNGADVHQRGVNDWTPLHYAVNGRDLTSVRFLLDRSADPTLKTRIDDYTTPLEDAEISGFFEAAALMRDAFAQHGNDRP